MGNEIADVEIVHHDRGAAGEYHAHLAGADPDAPTAGRLTWVARDSAQGPVRVVEHTLVPPRLEGRGIAAQLVAALIQDARAQGFLVDPQCSYVAVQFQRHPEWADLKA